MENLIFEKPEILAMSKAEVLTRTKKHHNRFFPKRKSWAMAFLMMMEGERDLSFLDFKTQKTKRALENKEKEFVRKGVQPQCLLIETLPKDCLFYLINFLDVDSLFCLASTCRTFYYFMSVAVLGKFKRAFRFQSGGVHPPLLYKGCRAAKDFLFGYETPHASDVGALRRARTVSDINTLSMDIRYHGSSYAGQVFRDKFAEVEALESKIIENHFNLFLDKAYYAGFAVYVNDLTREEKDIRSYIVIARRVVLTRVDKSTFNVEVFNPGFNSKFEFTEYNENKEFFQRLVNLESFDDLLTNNHICICSPGVYMVKIDNNEQRRLQKFKALLRQEGLTVMRRGKPYEEFFQSRLINLKWTGCHALLISRPDHLFLEVCLINKDFLDIVVKGLAYRDWPLVSSFRGMNLIMNYRDFSNFEPLGPYITLEQKISFDEVFQYIFEGLQKHGIKIDRILDRRTNLQFLSVNFDAHGNHLVFNTIVGGQIVNVEAVLGNLRTYLFSIAVRGYLPTDVWIESYANEIKKYSFVKISENMKLYYDKFNMSPEQVQKLNKSMNEQGYSFFLQYNKMSIVSAEQKDPNFVKIVFDYKHYNIPFSVDQKWLSYVFPKFDCERFAEYFSRAKKINNNNYYIFEPTEFGISYTPPAQMEEAMEPLLKKQK